MSKSATPTSKSVGTIDAPTTDRTSIASIVVGELEFIDDWHAFRTVAEVSEGTIHRVKA